MSYEQTNSDITVQSSDPDALRAEIERTRGNLSRDVNALGDAVSPGNVARRQAHKVGDAMAGVKDRVMGTASDAGSGVSSGVSGAASSVGDAASSVGDRASDAGQAARRKTQGNPMAAGLIALGAGWLLGSLLPATERERESAVALKEKAQPVLDEAQSVAKEMGQNLKEPAMESAQSVKETAASAAQTVKEEGQQAAQDVKGSAQDARDTVQETRSS